MIKSIPAAIACTLAIVAMAASCRQREVSMDESNFDRARSDMVARQIVARGVSDPAVLRAMRTVKRHLFVPRRLQGEAYGDYPLPIGMGQTISQPYVVAAMTEALQARPGMKVLEIGTGSGYQAAVLAEVGAVVSSIEIMPELAAEASERLERLEYTSIEVITGDGYRGLPEKAPFDRIIVTAAPPEVPKALAEQLAVGGRMVLPVGSVDQELMVIEKTASGLTRSLLFPVRFVPMVRGGIDG